MKWPLLIFAVAATGCTAPRDTTVVGPFTGSAHRYVVDSMTLPDHMNADELGDDLNGDGVIDNELGHLMDSLQGQNDAATDADDMIAARLIASVVVIQADDLVDDPRVGVSYFGSDGDPATAMGGAFDHGSLYSNRARLTSDTGAGTLVMPVFADADPSVLDVEEMEIELTPDGGVGFDAIVRGGITRASVSTATRVGLRQMLDADPGAHSGLAILLDQDGDGTITDQELVTSPLIETLEEPDLPSQLLSFGVFVHLSPCAAGSCPTAPPADHCNDRVRDLDETDVDCGGAACMPCGPGFACAAPADCQSPTCTNGTCTQPSCTDGIEDGFESGSDCGGLCAGACVGDYCTSDDQCQSGHCDVNDSCDP